MDGGETLQWNSEPDLCDRCGRRVERQKGYRLYVDGETKVLCASCYQQYLTVDSGGSTHDLIAEVDGGSG